MKATTVIPFECTYLYIYIYISLESSIIVNRELMHGALI